MGANCCIEDNQKVTTCHTDGVLHGRERPCSLACCGHYAMQFTKCHTTTMSFSVLESIFSVWPQMLVPTSQATIQVFLCTASLRRQLCHFRKQLALGGIGYRLLRCNKGWFLVAGLWEGVRGIIENMNFDQLFFCMLPFNVASHLCCFFGVFAFFRVLGGLTHHKVKQPRTLSLEQAPCR